MNGLSPLLCVNHSRRAETTNHTCNSLCASAVMVSIDDMGAEEFKRHGVINIINISNYTTHRKGPAYDRERSRTVNIGRRFLNLPHSK